MDEQTDIAQRLAKIEARLDALERTQPATPAGRQEGSSVAAAAAPASVAPARATQAPAAHATTLPHYDATSGTWRTPEQPVSPLREDGSTASRWMAWGAAIAFLLAAVYLLRLVYDSGWLTPPRQVLIAFIGGITLIATGLALTRIDRLYAAYLPAAGTVVLYVTAYAAHLYYQLIGREPALAAVSITSLLALWLGRRFDHSVFAALATVGTYLFPLWLGATHASVDEFIIYYAAWIVVFAVASLWEGRRTAYVLSMFGSLISFQFAWYVGGNDGDWAAAALFQCFLFLVSVVTAVVFSIRHRAPMGSGVAFVHGIALFYFYALEYVLLNRYTPDFVGHYALGSAVVVLFAYIAARRHLPAAQSAAGATLTSSYCAFVTAHILVFEWLTPEWLPWAALCAPLAGLAFAPVFRDTPQALLPIRIVSMSVFVIGFAASVVGNDGGQIPLPDLVLFAYAAAMYVGYVFTRDAASGSDTSSALLYAAHISTMLACSRLFDTGFGISLSWAVLALAVLAAALTLRDRNLGRSSLLVFAASAAKVLLVDLNGADSLLRVLSLVVVGVSLYAGGWLYQRMFRIAGPTPGAHVSAKNTATPQTPNGNPP